jgi:hypothetical protein
MAQYTASGIIYARATPANLAIATTQAGGNEPDITERISPPTLAAGQITCVPFTGSGTLLDVSTSGGITSIEGDGTDFVADFNVGQVLYAINTSGTYSLLGTIGVIDDTTNLKLTGVAVNTPSEGDTLAVTTSIVSGVGTDFENQFLVGQYLFAYDYSGSPYLVGQVLEINSSTQITLTQYASAAVVVASQCGMMDTLIKQSDSILIRIPTIVQNGQTIIPDWASLRLTFNDTFSYNNSTRTNLSQYSQVGDKLSVYNGATIKAPFTITPTNQIVVFKVSVNSNGRGCFANTGDFPRFTFAVYNPYGENPTVLSAATMFKLYTNETMEGIPISVNMENLILEAAGYNFAP